MVSVDRPTVHALGANRCELASLSSDRDDIRCHRLGVTRRFCRTTGPSQPFPETPSSPVNHKKLDVKARTDAKLALVDDDEDDDDGDRDGNGDERGDEDVDSEVTMTTLTPTARG